MKNIIISGNPQYGLANSLKKQFPKADFFSRSANETDFSKYEIRKDFAQKSLDYEIYISCSCLSQFRQTLLLEQVYTLWSKEEKSGQIICIGSSADTPVKGSSWVYPIEKKALRAYCRNLSQAALGGHGHSPSGVRVTYISPGYLDTPKANEKHPDVFKLNTDYLASMVDWVISQPNFVNLSEICLDPIQQEV